MSRSHSCPRKAKPTAIALQSYTHRQESTPVAADSQPGYYYVSVKNESKHAALLGPFPQHQQALDWVVACRDYANDRDPWSHFYSFGTCRVPLEVEPVSLPIGRLNDVFPDAEGLRANPQQEQHHDHDRT